MKSNNTPNSNNDENNNNNNTNNNQLRFLLSVIQERSGFVAPEVEVYTFYQRRTNPGSSPNPVPAAAAIHTYTPLSSGSYSTSNQETEMFI